MKVDDHETGDTPKMKKEEESDLTLKINSPNLGTHRIELDRNFHENVFCITSGY